MFFHLNSMKICEVAVHQVSLKSNEKQKSFLTTHLTDGPSVGEFGQVWNQLYKGLFIQLCVYLSSSEVNRICDSIGNWGLTMYFWVIAQLVNLKPLLAAYSFIFISESDPELITFTLLIFPLEEEFTDMSLAYVLKIFKSGHWFRSIISVTDWQNSKCNVFKHEKLIEGVLENRDPVILEADKSKNWRQWAALLMNVSMPVWSFIWKGKSILL